MNAPVTLNNALFSLPISSTGINYFKVHPLVTFSTMNHVEVVLHTEMGPEKYRVEERDSLFIIYKYQRHFFGFSYFKKLAKARSREGALKIIHILSSGEVVGWEVCPVDYFENDTF